MIVMLKSLRSCCCQVLAGPANVGKTSQFFYPKKTYQTNNTTNQPHEVVLYAIQGIRYAALAKRFRDKLAWDVLPSLVDPPADLIEFHLANTAASSKGLLAGQHPRLPLLPRTIFKGDVDCSIQGLQHTCHPFHNCHPSPPPPQE